MTSTQPRQKSGASRTSISVKLPNAEDDDRRSETSGNIGGYNERPGNGPVQRDSVMEAYAAANNPKQSQKAAAYHRSTKRTFKERILIERTAVAIIERTWVSYRDCQMFRLLKHAVCAAENSLTTEILRKVSPKEAALLSDKSLQIRVRFRFGGSEFPPMIFFKLFIHGNGTGVKYISGKKIIKPSTGAAEEALRQMGNRVFYDQLLKDNIHQQQFRITDELDVTTLKDYMQYLANLDETPAYMGGKENYWRKLTLDDVPRHTMFYDVVDYLYSHRLSDRLRAEVPLLMLRPINQAIQRQHIKIVSQFRPLPTVYHPPPTTQPHSQHSITERRSRQARRRAQKMRRAFGLPDPEDSEMSIYEGGVGGYQPGTEALEGGEEDWEEEAHKLYEWTQDLSYEDINSTPRIAT